MTSQHIVLIGLKSSGKSTIAKALAKILNQDFIDTDDAIEVHYNKNTETKLSYKALLQKLGRKKFHDLEETVIAQISARKEPIIIATGGSSLLRKNNAKILAESGRIIYLKASYQTLLQRWQENPPSFIESDNLEKELNNYIAQRANKYEEISALIVTTDEKTSDEIAAEIVQLLPDSCLGF